MRSIHPLYATSRIFGRTALVFTAFCFAAGAADAQTSAKPLVTPGFSMAVFATG
ncbi:hypothetical protein [Paraburkholderia youngii]|uniref:Uncharacterized protein n=2 Tax=Paraburkholderia TaxID=1822464 RepID=A0A7Y6JXS4_9BURK|nr:hypothetical protein [Paraburkholderia youngii]NUX99797.1 hypothetical protein [Paraburkholderia youngii]